SIRVSLNATCSTTERRARQSVRGLSHTSRATPASRSPFPTRRRSAVVFGLSSKPITLMFSTPLLIPILIIFGCAFLVMGSCIALYETKSDLRIHPQKKRKLEGAALYVRVGLNGAFSTSIILAFVFLFEGALVSHEASSLGRAA